MSESKTVSKVQELFVKFANNVLSLESTLNVCGQMLQGRKNNVTIGGKSHVDTDWSAEIAKRDKSAKKFVDWLAHGDESFDRLRVRTLAAILEQTSRELSKRAFYTLCAFESADAIVEFIADNDIQFPDGVDTRAYWQAMFTSVEELAKVKGYTNVADIFTKGSKSTDSATLADFADLL